VGKMIKEKNGNMKENKIIGDDIIENDEFI
jgi:hypothetical protein